MNCILVANRGEIARRIIRAAHALGLRAATVYAEDERDAPYVAEADVAVALGDGPLERTFLNTEKVIEAARRVGADALHPGYGFLSERAELAEACEHAGIVFVGPPAAAIQAMGHKEHAKRLVADAGVPTLPSLAIPGVGGAADAALSLDGVGLPLLVKASGGGGGRGMRLVTSREDLSLAIEAAQREAAASFGSADVFLERYLPSPRHVEVQVLGDQHGTVVHLYDRDCSVQRRHQKVIEEAPAAGLPRELRTRMWDAAVSAAHAVGYVGAGTVEFLVQGEEFFFLEMNTRLQVEHPVTEAITGLDLVALQLLVATGAPLPLQQADIAVSGHAIEARLCAEQPRLDYRPSAGHVAHVSWPVGLARVDTAIEAGAMVSPLYDSLVAKVITHGPTREVAVARLHRALASELELDGVETNRVFLASVLGDAEFVEAPVSTAFLERRPDLRDAALPAAVVRCHLVAAALARDLDGVRRGIASSVPPGWTNVRRGGRRQTFVVDEEPIDVVVDRAPDGTTVTADGESSAVRVLEWADGRLRFELDGVHLTCRVRVRDEAVYVNSAWGQSACVLRSRFATTADAGAAGDCVAPLPGAVVATFVSPGDAVSSGDPLIVVEAMKMEHTLIASQDGIVSEVVVSVGDRVEAHQVLVRLDERSPVLITAGSAEEGGRPDGLE